MMVKKITSFILAALICLTVSLPSKELSRKETRFVNAVATETRTYMKTEGYYVDKYDLIVFTKSSYRVANMFPSFPSTDKSDRVKKFMSWGGQESVWKPNYVAINIPGAKYATGRVKRFSVDFDWTGINSENLKWTYELATAIQQRRPLPKGTNKTLRVMLQDVRIPKDLKLKRIDYSSVVEAKKQYRVLNAMYRDKNKIAEKITIAYSSTTEDDVDSMLIYRILVEMDRQARGWEQGAYHDRLYSHLGNLDMGL